MIYNATINITAGNGGNGKASFYTSRRTTKGGPNGGNGGNGGDVILIASQNQKSLHYLKLNPHIKALHGTNGSSGNKNGAHANHKTLLVPIGTQVYIDDNLIADLDQHNATIIIAKGGKGGKGNVHFKSPTNQAPIEFETGTTGTTITCRLELKTIADIGIIGLPNAGKSSLLAAISNAKPKIANYPFTTITPQIGTVTFPLTNNQQSTSLTFVDIPGLIKGAANNKGLGHEFLAHIERCKILIHLIDATTDILQNYSTIQTELHLYCPELLLKPQIIVLNKIDLIHPSNLTAITNLLPTHHHFISIHNNIGINHLLQSCYIVMTTDSN